MSIEALPAEIAESPPAARRPGTVRMLLGNWSVVIGAAIVALLAVVGLLAPALGTISPSEINPVFRNKKPGEERIIRTDDGKSIARQGYKLFRGGREIGGITSGTYAPSFERPLAMAYVATSAAIADSDHLEVAIRNRMVAATVVPLPFYRRPKGT